MRVLAEFAAGAALLCLALCATGAERAVNVASPAWGTQITATSAFSAAHAAGNVADGSVERGHSWLSADNAALPQILTLTFAEPFRLTLARVCQAQWNGSMYHTKDFRVEGSADGKTFQSIASGTLADTAEAEWTQSLSNSVLRAVRIVIVSSYTAVQTCGLGKVELIASLPEDQQPPLTAGAERAVNVALPVWGTQITATSAYSDTNAAGNVADGSSERGHGWFSADNVPLPQTVTLALHEPFNLSLIRIHQAQWIGSMYHTKDFRVEGSADGKTFQPIASGTLADSDEAEWTQPFSNSLLRAIRIVILSSYTAVQTCGLGEVELMASLPEDRHPIFKRP